MAKTIGQNDKSFKVGRADITLLESSPRFIAVHVHAGGMRLLLLSVHLPQQNRPQSEREEVLSMLHDVVLKYGHATAIILGIDSNSRVPTDFMAVTGDLPFGEPDECGWRFVEALASNGLWLPSTFSSHHKGSSATWMHSSGNESRIDFIAVGGCIDSFRMESKVAEHFDLLTPNYDHWAVQIHMRVVFQHAVRRSGRLKKPKFDRTKIMSETGRHVLQQAVAALPQLEWNTHPDMHARMIENQLSGILNAHFLLPQNGPVSEMPNRG